MRKLTVVLFSLACILCLTPVYAEHIHDCDAPTTLENDSHHGYRCTNWDETNNYTYTNDYCHEEDCTITPNGTVRCSRNETLTCTGSTCSWDITVFCGGVHHSIINVTAPPGVVPRCDEDTIQGGPGVFECDSPHLDQGCSCQTSVGGTLDTGTWSCWSASK